MGSKKNMGSYIRGVPRGVLLKGRVGKRERLDKEESKASQTLGPTDPKNAQTCFAIDVSTSLTAAGTLASSFQSRCQHTSDGCLYADLRMVCGLCVHQATTHLSRIPYPASALPQAHRGCPQASPQLKPPGGKSRQNRLGLARNLVIILNSPLSHKFAKQKNT